MAKSLSYAAEKWSRKTASAGTKWKSALDAGASARYCSAFDEFVGHSTPQACAAYSAGINAVSASDFQSAVSGKQGAYTAALQRVA